MSDATVIILGILGAACLVAAAWVGLTTAGALASTGVVLAGVALLLDDSPEDL